MANATPTTKHPTARVIRVPFLIPLWAAAQVWGRTILLRTDATPTVRLMAHELVHVDQWARYGWTFPFRYGWQLLRHGYRKNRFEQEAWLLENTPIYQRRARLLIHDHALDHAN